MTITRHMLAAVLAFGPALAMADDDGAIAEASAAWAAILNAGDVDGVRQLHSEDTRVMPPDAPLMLGPDQAAGFWEAAFSSGVGDVVLELQHVDMMDDMALEYGLWAAKAPDGSGGTVDIQGKYVHIWRLEDGEWKMRADIWNDSPAE